MTMSKAFYEKKFPYFEGCKNFPLVNNNAKRFESVNN